MTRDATRGRYGPPPADVLAHGPGVPTWGRVVTELSLGVFLYDALFYPFHLSFHKLRARRWRKMHARHHVWGSTEAAAHNAVETVHHSHLAAARHRPGTFPEPSPNLPRPFPGPSPQVQNSYLDAGVQVFINIFVQHLSPWGFKHPLSRALHNVIGGLPPVRVTHPPLDRRSPPVGDGGLPPVRVPLRLRPALHVAPPLPGPLRRARGARAAPPARRRLQTASHQAPDTTRQTARSTTAATAAAAAAATAARCHCVRSAAQATSTSTSSSSGPTGSSDTPPPPSRTGSTARRRVSLPLPSTFPHLALSPQALAAVGAAQDSARQQQAAAEVVR